MTELVERTADLTKLPGEFSPTALVLPDDLPFEDWTSMLSALVTTDSSLAWWIGDALNHGHKVYGETYAQAVEATGLDYDVLTNYAWVAGAVEPSTRVETLSWSHHRAVAKLDAHEQREALHRAVGEGYSVRELQAWLSDGAEPPSSSVVGSALGDARSRAERVGPLERVADVSRSLCDSAEPLNGRRTEKLRAVPVELLRDLDVALSEVPPT